MRRIPKGTNKLLVAMNNAGIRVTPESVQEMVLTLSDADADVAAAIAADARSIWADMAAIDSKPVRRGPSKASRDWNGYPRIYDLGYETRMKAVDGSLKDRIAASHRPGGKIAPKPRWDAYKKPPEQVIVINRKGTKKSVDELADLFVKWRTARQGT